MSAKFFDPQGTVIYLAGITMSGFADGEFLTYERMSDGFNDVVGSDGEVCRSKSNDRRVKCTIKLLQSSLINLALSTLHNTDLNAPNGAGVGAWLHQDLQGNTLVSAQQAWITKFPDGSWDRTPKMREWVVMLADAQQVEGGNP